jgi:hypothetical protein
VATWPSAISSIIGRCWRVVWNDYVMDRSTPKTMAVCAVVFLAVGIVWALLVDPLWALGYFVCAVGAAASWRKATRQAPRRSELSGNRPPRPGSRGSPAPDLPAHRPYLESD